MRIREKLYQKYMRIREKLYQKYMRIREKEEKRTIREVDFLIREKNKIIPIEVKSSDKFTTKSLIDFKTAYSDKVGQGIVLHEGDIKKENDIIYYPYFMATIL